LNPSRRTIAAASAGLFLWVFFLFATTLTSGFLKYDDWWIVRHERMESWLTPAGVGETFLDFSRQTRMAHGAEYLPLRDLSAAIQNSLFGENPLGYRVVAVTLFALAGLLLFRLLLSLGFPVGRAWLGGALFLAHPVHVESVAWLSGHKDLLSLVFLLGHLLTYVRGRFGTSFALLGAALLSKYNVIAVPLVLPLLDRVAGRDVSLRRWALFLLLPLLGGILAASVGGVVEYGHMNLGTSLPALARNLPVVFEEAMFRLLAPTGLQLFYPFEAASSWLDLRVLRGSALILLSCALFLRGVRRDPALSVGLALIPAGLIPMFRAPEMHFLADRYLLVSSIGWALLAAWGLSKIGSAFLWAAIAIGAGGVLSCGTLSQNRVWENDRALWEHAAGGRKPVHARVWGGLAVAARDGGDWRRSEEAYLRLLPLLGRNDPRRAEHLTDLGYVRIRQEKWGEAEEALRQAVASDPSFFQARLNLGTVLAMTGRRKEARGELKAARKIDASNADVGFNLARLALESGDLAAAERLLNDLRVTASEDARLEFLARGLAVARGKKR
jgi:tetratricopeptide (TPR) repeat protein